MVPMIREHFFHANAFEPEMVKRLCDAYDLAMEALRGGGQTNIAPEIVALHVITFAKQGVTDTTGLCLRTLRAVSGESAANADPRPTDSEYLRWIHAGTKRTAQSIAESIALVEAGNALVSRIEQQLAKSILWRSVR